ncbi:hypothetical protein KCP76_18890 [Salmonella enterica subsp. enterica serovar Weltevreden]|nr:hypothetical protein KCP76_18890 [Salmonella enterica subsp. enterica serovar Weltevreden]
MAHCKKSQNGGDIPDMDYYLHRISVRGAGVQWCVAIGGDANPWTTAERTARLENCGIQNHPYWMCKGSGLRR